MRPLARAIGILSGAALALFAEVVRADSLDLPPGPLDWDPAWHTVGVLDYTATGVFAAGSIMSFAIPPKPTNWVKADGFDKSARAALRFSTADGRGVARDASDALLTVSIDALIADAAAIAWWKYDRREIAWQLAIMDTETLAMAAFAQGLTSGLVSRERPYGAACGVATDADTTDCRDNTRYRSFFSGHATVSFAAAGLMCQHHAHIPLYGGGAPDVLACASSVVLAGSIAYLRVAADEHYMSDVLVGAGVGTLIGLGAPWLLHYRHWGVPAKRLAGGGYVMLAPSAGGASMIGAF